MIDLRVARQQSVHYRDADARADVSRETVRAGALGPPARFAGRCVSNGQEQKCLSGSLDRSGDGIVGLGTDDRFKSLHRARAQQSDA
jgi:hypothetical protein